MHTLYMKIHSFEEQSKSLIVSFASNTTKSQNPDDYPSYAYQPVNMWPDISDPAEIKKRLAMAGIHHAEQQERQEKFVDDSAKVQEYRNMAGQQVTYAVSDLIPPAETDATPIISTVVV